MRKLTALLPSCFLFSFLHAQVYLKQPSLHDRPHEKKVTFWDIQRAFNEQWENKTPSDTESENEEDGGYQQFKRWEWFVKQRTFPTGEFPSPEILFDEYQKYKTTYGSQKNQQTQSANWNFIGPGVLPGSGGGSGRINCIAFDPNNTSIIWTGTACGGLWKSTDGGQTWNSNTDLLPSLSISDIVIDPSNAQTMYLATGDKYGIYWQYETWGHYSAGVLKSTDGGLTWNPTGLNYSLANVTIIERLVQDPNNANTLFAATNMGIFKTTDGGNTWNNVQNGSFYDIEFKPGSSNTIYAGDATGFLLSTNGGSTWNYTTGVSSTGRTSIAVSAANANTVYCWTEGGNFYYSSNSGTSFTARTDPSTNCTPYGYYDMVLEVSPVNDQVIFTGGLDIAKSTDGGNTWTTTSDWSAWPATNYVHADNHAQKFLPGSSNTIFSCNDGGIFKSTDQGGTWSDLSNGISI
ncbi:MAG TPA: YCF48-related protein, partial [Bacteroidia bacterium]